MHYCQDCDEPQRLVPVEGSARCPRCGWVAPDLRVAPLFLVTGASGAGKSTLLPLLLRRLGGTCAVFDVDWLIDPLARSAPDGEVDWPAFRDTWLHVAHGVAQNGVDPVLLGPFFPQQLQELPGRAWVGAVHTLLLDCPDDERRARMRARPAWRARDIDEQVAFGRWLREHVPTVLDTTSTTPEQAADAVAAWVRAQRPGNGPGSSTTPVRSAARRLR